MATSAQVGAARAQPWNEWEDGSEDENDWRNVWSDVSDEDGHAVVPISSRKKAAAAGAAGPPGKLVESSAAALDQRKMYVGKVEFWSAGAAYGCLKCDVLGDADIFFNEKSFPEKTNYRDLDGAIVSFSLQTNWNELEDTYYAVNATRKSEPSLSQPEVAPTGSGARGGAVSILPADLCGRVVVDLTHRSVTPFRKQLTSPHTDGSTSPSKRRGVTAWDAGMVEIHERAARYDRVVDAVDTNEVMRDLIMKIHDRISRELEGMYGSETERQLARAERSASSAILYMALDEQLKRQFTEALSACGTIIADSVESHSVLNSLVLAVTRARDAFLNERVGALPPFQPDFVAELVDMNDLQSQKFSYIVGWVVLKLRKRIGFTPEKSTCAIFIQRMCKREEMTYDASRLQKRTTIVPSDWAYKFTVMVESLVSMLISKFYAVAGSAFFILSKRAALGNASLQNAWLELVHSSGAPLDQSQQNALFLLWISYFLKSRQKEVLRSKELLPKPSPALRPGLKGISSGRSSDQQAALDGERAPALAPTGSDQFGSVAKRKSSAIPRKRKKEGVAGDDSPAGAAPRKRGKPAAAGDDGTAGAAPRKRGKSVSAAAGEDGAAGAAPRERGRPSPAGRAAAFGTITRSAHGSQ